MSLGFTLIAGGCVAFFFPAFIWGFEMWWQPKSLRDTEPSDTELLIIRIGGAIAFLVGVFCLTGLRSNPDFSFTDFLHGEPHQKITEISIPIQRDSSERAHR